MSTDSEFIVRNKVLAGRFAHSIGYGSEFKLAIDEAVQHDSFTYRYFLNPVFNPPPSFIFFSSITAELLSKHLNKTSDNDVDLLFLIQQNILQREKSVIFADDYSRIELPFEIDEYGKFMIRVCISNQLPNACYGHPLGPYATSINSSLPHYAISLEYVVNGK